MSIENTNSRNSNDFEFFRVCDKPDYGWIVQSLPAVVVAPVQIRDRVSSANLKNGLNIGMIQIFRKPIEQLGWELPGGSIENNEQPWQAAKRELLEETGMETNEIEEIGQFYEAPGRMLFHHYVFVAKDPKLSAHHVNSFQTSEEIRGFQFISFEETERMIEQGKIISGPTLSGLSLLKLWIKNYILST